jgi:hypothetical protein
MEVEGMIKVKGRDVTFTGKDLKWLERESKLLGMSKQDFFTAVMWEAILAMKRREVLACRTLKKA